MKKWFYALMVATFIMTGVSTAYAGNISFNVTVGGSGAQDPLSKRARKSSDGDNRAYYRPTYTSNTRSYIMVESVNLNNQTIRTPQLTQLCSLNIGKTLNRDYNVTAPGGQYYFMNSTNEGVRINVKGYYCP